MSCAPLFIGSDTSISSLVNEHIGGTCFHTYKQHKYYYVYSNIILPKVYKTQIVISVKNPLLPSTWPPVQNTTWPPKKKT